MILLGPPGAGKGTQSVLLSEFCQVPHVSTGDILRQAVAEGTPLGKKAEHYMNAGDLVPDHLIIDLIRERLSHDDAQNGWILDGFPRNVPQAEFLDQLLAEIFQPCDFVLNLEVPDEAILTRLLKRGRRDDTENVIQNRLQVYRNLTEPVIEFYRLRQRLVSVDGNRPMNMVAQSLKTIVKG